MAFVSAKVLCTSPSCIGWNSLIAFIPIISSRVLINSIKFVSFPFPILKILCGHKLIDLDESTNFFVLSQVYLLI